tara:strand:- start:198 stop:383 length:186 start_codon:yes stop_codon:yes gene_type:complete
MKKYLILVFGLVAASVVGYGYINNILELLNLIPFEFTGKSILGIVGLFIPPLGVIMGVFVW